MNTPLYLLERFDMGIVRLDAACRVVDMNEFARRVLPVGEKQPFMRGVLDFHPERSRSKVGFLIDQARTCPVASPPAMTMIINIPERVLLIKLSKMLDGAEKICGYTLVFHDITELVAEAVPANTQQDLPRQLARIPTTSGNQTVFVDAEEVLRLQSEGHYTRVFTADGPRFCNLSISDLASRLDARHFMRVHRSHIVNLRALRELVRSDGRVSLRMRGSEGDVPVSRSSTVELLQRLGLSDPVAR